MCDADGGAEGVHALQRLRQEGSQAHLQDGRYGTNLHLLVHCNARASTLLPPKSLYLPVKLNSTPDSCQT
jgi:hypothetical protein